jgi:Cys-tRNA(Pro)/Cys-tRNA(Cys) deacylase
MQLPVHDYLDALGIPYTTGSFPPTTTKGAAEVAKAFGYAPRQMVKTLIFEVDTGEKVLVMVGGDQNAISGHLKKAIGSRNIKLASPQTVQETTGYTIGSIPPFHWQPPQFRTFMDAALLHEDILGVGTGTWGQEIFITPSYVVQVSRAIIVNLTDTAQPVFLA